MSGIINDQERIGKEENVGKVMEVYLGRTVSSEPSTTTASVFV